MATITHEADGDIQIGDDGAITATRILRISGTSMWEIVNSRVIPQRGSRHPKNTMFFLTAGNVSQVDNSGRGCTVNAELTYTNSSDVIREFTGDPWDLGAQNISVRNASESAPFLCGYNESGRLVDNVNSAGCRILAETTRGIREISFMFCVKAKRSGNAPINDDPLINGDTVKVAGFPIPAGKGLLMPMDASFITEYDGAGNTIKRQYWNINATIRYNSRGWAKRELDVGTMAFFATNGTLIRKPRPIYQYTPWESTDPVVNFRVQPRIGSIDDVIQAKNTYAALFGTSERQSRWDELPQHEITEPLPLRTNGTVYEEAMADPANYPYNQKVLYDYVRTSWSKWNLPKSRA